MEEINNIDMEELLLHWWHYYGRLWYTFEEIEKFREIIKEKGAEKVLEVAVASVICQDGKNTALLMSIRENKLDELFAALPNIDEMSPESKEMYQKVKSKFLDEIKYTYLHRGN